MKALWLVLASAAWLWGAVEGVVMNQTKAAPQPGVVVTLYKLGGDGMSPVKTVRSDSQGAFRININVDGPHLLQTIHDNVIYNRMVAPGTPTTGLTLEIFDSSPQPGAVKPTTHMVLLEPIGDALRVSQSVIYQNSGKTSWSDPKRGTLRFFLPEAAGGNARVMATAPNGMPVERPAEDSGAKNVKKVDFAVKPGETRFDITYSVPFQSPGTFSGKVIPEGAPVRIVAPQGVSVQGANLKLLGQEPSTQASIYEVSGNEYELRIEGSGTLQDPNAAAEEDSGAGLQQIRPRIYDRLGVILGLAFLILLLGFLLMYRKPVAKAKGG